MTVLTIFFSYFAFQRAKYDRLHTQNVTKLANDVVINQGATLQLWQIEGGNAVKVEIMLSCQDCQADESFHLKILDKDGQIIFQDSFVPAFGRFCQATQFAKEVLPLKIVIQNDGAKTRKIRGQIKYAEVT